MNENIDIPYGLTVRGFLKNEDEMLLVKRSSKSKTDPNMWELPGGKVDLGESFDNALIREFKEETNLNIKIGDFLHGFQHDLYHKRTVVLVFDLMALNNDIKISHEHDDFKWVKLDNLNELVLSSTSKPFFKNFLKK
ncbi:MAG: NUDIX domain-containing protein [Methanobrevibacter sp.]|jgi:8-oxo-dGTP diphosphatase|nr:NUDIX domain-containing protein [Methanobrevibacter sp.]